MSKEIFRGRNGQYQLTLTENGDGILIGIEVYGRGCYYQIPAGQTKDLAKALNYLLEGVDSLNEMDETTKLP